MSATRETGGPEPETIELPAPTVWPMVLAFGVTLAFAGLVTNAIVSIVGVALALVASVGWWRQVLPAQQHERVPLRPVSERARPIVPSRAAVDRLKLGEAGHRVRIPVEVQPVSAGIKGGIVGGVAMAVVAVAYGAIVQGSVWYPINLLSAVAMPGMAQANEESSGMKARPCRPAPPMMRSIRNAARAM